MLVTRGDICLQQNQNRRKNPKDNRPRSGFSTLFFLHACAILRPSSRVRNRLRGPRPPSQPDDKRQHRKDLQNDTPQQKCLRQCFLHHHKRHQHKLCRGEHCRKAEHPGVQKLTRALSYFQKIRPQKTDPDRHEHEHPNHIEQALTAHTPELLQARFPVLPPHS